MRRSRAFTLIEILVVLSILALLASLLLPAFAAARSRAREVACASNLRQVGAAMRMYTEDYDGRFPLGAYNSQSPTPGPVWNVTWHDLLFPYAGSHVGVFVCPSLPGEATLRHAYGCNPWLSGFYFAVTESAIRGDSLRVWAADKATGDWPIYPWSYHDDPGHSYLTPRHNDRVAVLWTDGHATSTYPVRLDDVNRFWNW